jgi:hypothetical protein
MAVETKSEDTTTAPSSKISKTAHKFWNEDAVEIK